MKLSFYKIELTYPVFVGWYILELSKLHVYDLYYKVLKENYSNGVNLVWMDTNSFLLEFKNFDVYKEMQNGVLKEHMDLFNFSINNPLDSEENKGHLVFLKSETGDNPTSEVNCLAQKCYSVLWRTELLRTRFKGLIDHKKRISSMTRT